MMTDPAGTTLREVPDPTIDWRRTQARRLQREGLSYGQIADQLGVARHIVQEDLRPTRKPAPPSFRLPDDVADAIREEAAREGISMSQVVVRALRHWFKHRRLEDAKNARKRARRREGSRSDNNA